MISRRAFVASLTSGLLAAPLAAVAQQKAMPMIGVLNTGSPPSPISMDAFRQGLREAGYVEGQNVAIEYRWAEGHYDRLPALAADLVGRKVDLIMANSPPAAVAAKSATSTIPIVMRVAPTRSGAGSSPASPGRAATSRGLALSSTS